MFNTQQTTETSTQTWKHAFTSGIEGYCMTLQSITWVRMVLYKYCVVY